MSPPSKTPGGAEGTAEALFALGLALPLFAGGNTLLALEPSAAMTIFDLTVVGIAWRLPRFARTTGTVPRARRIALGCAVLLGSWWIAALLLRPSGPRATIDAQGILCAILLFAILSRTAIASDELRGFIRGVLLGSAVTVILSQYQYWVVFPRTAPLIRQMGITPSVLVNANFYNTNCYAVFLAGVTILGAPLAIRRRDAIAVAVVPFVVVTLLLTQSRSAIALLSVTAAALWWLSAPRQASPRTGLVYELPWILLPAAAGAAVASVDLEELWNVGTLGRVTIWTASLAMIRDHWLFGVGLGGYGDWFGRYRLNDYYTRYPHSFPLEIGAELGVVGLASVVGFLIAASMEPLSRLAKRTRHADDGDLLTICAASALLLLHGLVDIDWHAPANPILLFVLLGIAQHLATAPSEKPRGT